jgi:hypothetical protein
LRVRGGRSSLKRERRTRIWGSEVTVKRRFCVSNSQLVQGEHGNVIVPVELLCNGYCQLYFELRNEITIEVVGVRHHREA